jgi:RNA polymerase sigma-70 factor (ECF subfamily)
LELDDLTLLRRFQEGDQRAFKVLVERYQRKVFAIAYGMVRDRDVAEDIAQESFVRVHRYIDHFKGDSSFYTWLYRITSNLAIDHLRSHKARSEAYDEAVQASESETLPDGGVLGTRLGTNPQKSALRRELAEKMEEALAQLPEKHREILVLRELDGMSYEDLARVLKIPKGTVMSRLFHARAKMQKALAPYLEGDSPEAGVGEEEG